MKKIELGGGVGPRGNGFVNLDILECADIQIDLETTPLPYSDDSVDEVFSGHCLEHVRNAYGVLAEILRVSRVGAKVELRFPHWLHPMASSPGHVHVLTEWLFREFLCRFPERYWPDSRKTFRFIRSHYQVEIHFATLRAGFPKLTDDQVAQTIPGCCHEVHLFLEVVAR